MQQKPDWLQILSWAVYDFANTIFSMNMLSMYFPLWVTQDMKGRDMYYSIAVAVSVLAAGALMPLIGATSQRTGRHVRYIIALTTLSCVCTASIGLTGSLVAALALFAVANFGFMAALVPYDSLIPRLSRGIKVGSVSGIGVAMGYVGSIGGLLMVKPFVDAGGRAAAFLPTGILFLAFAVPLFLFVKDRPRPATRGFGIAREYKKIGITLRNTKKYPGLLRFLIANLIYSDAVNTVIIFMAVYASAVIGMNDAQIRTLMISSTVFAVVGSYAAGRLTDAIGPRRALMYVLLLWAFTLGLAFISISRTMFWAVGPLAGVSLGSTWVTSRALVVRLSPPHKVGEVFGLYNLGGKFGFVVGPLMWGGIVWILEPYGVVRYRWAIFSLLVFVLIAMAVLKKVPEGLERAEGGSEKESEALRVV